MAVDLLLKNCRIVRDIGIIDGDIAIDSGMISAVARNLSEDADIVIDIGGRIVLPGLIDPHVHFRDPGFTHKEDFESGSMSAAFGGVTTVIDMPNNKPRVDCTRALEVKRRHAKNSYVDYGFYFEITRDNLGSLIGDRFKVYIDAPERADYDTLQDALKRLDRKLVAVHAEDPATIQENMKKFSSGKPSAHTKVRSVEAEITAVKRILGMDFGTNYVHFCHVSTPQGFDLIESSGKMATCEFTPHHLFLDSGAYKKLGPFAKVNPALKPRKEVEGLWERIGKVDCIGTDHAPHTAEEKQSENPPSGFPGVETNLLLLMNAVNSNKLSWEEVARLTSQGPSEILGLKDKGSIEVGKDADIVVVDNGLERVISAESLHSRCGWTPYENWKVKGDITKVFLRGNLIIDEMELLGREGFGVEV